MSSGYDIDVEKFRDFAYNTARYFVQKYPWCNMTPTLHKYLIHGPEIISSACLPIGQLTEEAQEARNKDFKNCRENYSRKCSRQKTNADILNYFLISSDPLITSKRKLPKRKLQGLPKEAIDLLRSPNISTISPKSRDDDDDTDDDGGAGGDSSN